MSQVLVRREFHPVNLKRDPSFPKCGLATVKYSPFDRVTIICDTIRMHHLQTNTAKTKKEKDDEKRRKEEDALEARHMTILKDEEDEEEDDEKKKKKKRRFKCLCGEDEEQGPFVESSDKDAMVCMNCGVVCEKITKALHREKACAADEDSTTRADVPLEQVDRFQEAKSVGAARSLKRGFDVLQNTAEKDRKLHGFTREICARLAERADESRGKMTARDQDREYQLMARVENLFENYDPVPEQIKRAVRVHAYTFFQKYVAHEHTCKRKTCCFTGIRAKSMQYLAHACIGAVLDSVAEGEIVIEDVREEQVKNVLERVTEQDMPPRLRFAKKEVRIFLGAACSVPEKEIEACEEGAVTVETITLQEDEKQRSITEKSEEVGGDFGRQLRKFLRKLSFVEGEDLVKHAILFADDKFELLQPILEASELSWQAKAFAWLDVAARKQQGEDFKRPSARMKPRLLASLGTTNEKMMDLISSIFKIIF